MGGAMAYEPINLDTFDIIFSRVVLLVSCVIVWFSQLFLSRVIVSQRPFSMHFMYLMALDRFMVDVVVMDISVVDIDHRNNYYEQFINNVPLMHQLYHLYHLKINFFYYFYQYTYLDSDPHQPHQHHHQHHYHLNTND